MANLFRRARQFIEYEAGVRAGRCDPLAPPGWLHSVGNGDFVAISEEFFRYFVDAAVLKPHEKVLDVGCGTGRMARPLAKYLQGGTYDGFDIVAKSPLDRRWRQQHSPQARAPRVLSVEGGCARSCRRV